MAKFSSKSARVLAAKKKDSALHWTAKSIANYHFAIADYFWMQIEDRLDALHWDLPTLSKRVNISCNKINKIVDNPQKMSLAQMIKLAKAVGLKLTVLAYDDSEPMHGPILPAIFLSCWERSGRPRSMFAITPVAKVKNGTGASSD